MKHLIQVFIVQVCPIVVWRIQKVLIRIRIWILLLLFVLYPDPV